MSVGIDLERLDALDRFDEASVARAGRRLLGAAERRWCAGQASPSEAIIVIFCCREAAFKCRKGLPSVLELTLAPVGHLSHGMATLSEAAEVEITVAWRIIENQVLAIAASGPSRIPADLLRCVSGRQGR